jgi:hypothetical protein
MLILSNLQTSPNNISLDESFTYSVSCLHLNLPVTGERKNCKQVHVPFREKKNR